MTFEKLKELIEKYNIPNNVKLLSDSGWELSETEMDGIFYNQKENHIVFTQNPDERGYLRNEDYIMLEEDMEKITQKQIKELIKRILKGNYNKVLELRNRLTPDGENVIYQEDHLNLDIVLDLYDLLDLLLNSGDEESIKDKFLEIAEFYHWDFELNDFIDYEEQDPASYYVWLLEKEMKK